MLKYVRLPRVIRVENDGMLEKYNLEADFGPSMVEGQLLKTLKHETVNGAYTYEFKVTEGVIVFSVSRGKLQEVSYQFASILPWVRNKWARTLLDAYARDSQWKLSYKGKSGKMFHSQDERFYAAIGKSAKYFNIGSMLFHDEKFKVVS